jgi:cellulose synthase/poly-beta-1,6-N-acetylglucosamine synthase-like glycosyltransferase
MFYEFQEFSFWRYLLKRKVREISYDIDTSAVCLYHLIDNSLPLICFSMKNLVKIECEEWAKKGINIKYEVRNNRKGYKAGALKKGMEHCYAKQCDFVAIFDADFQPDSDFLLKTLPFLVHNSEIALVQTRWDFG